MRGDRCLQSGRAPSPLSFLPRSPAQTAGRGHPLLRGDGEEGAGAPGGHGRPGDHERRGQVVQGARLQEQQAPAADQQRHPRRAEEKGEKSGVCDHVVPQQQSTVLQLNTPSFTPCVLADRLPGHWRRRRR